MKVWKKHFEEDEYREEVAEGAETDEASDPISGSEQGSEGADENNVLHAELPYTTGAWDNHTLYQCTKCPYSTLDLETMERHLLMHRAEDELRR